MSKTLSLKGTKLDAIASDGAKVSFESLPAPFTEEQLRAMLADIEAAKPEKPHLVADKSVLPPVDERVSAPVQVPPKLWGIHDPRLVPPSPISAPNVNPATGFAHNQVSPQPKGGMISPPPSRNFR